MKLLFITLSALVATAFATQVDDVVKPTRHSSTVAKTTSKTTSSTHKPTPTPHRCIADGKPVDKPFTCKTGCCSHHCSKHRPNICSPMIEGRDAAPVEEIENHLRSTHKPSTTSKTSSSSKHSSTIPPHKPTCLPYNKPVPYGATCQTACCSKKCLKGKPGFCAPKHHAEARDTEEEIMENNLKSTQKLTSTSSKPTSTSTHKPTTTPHHPTCLPYNKPVPKDETCYSACCAKACIRYRPGRVCASPRHAEARDALPEDEIVENYPRPSRTSSTTLKTSSKATSTLTHTPTHIPGHPPCIQPGKKVPKGLTCEACCHKNRCTKSLPPICL